MFLCLLKNTDCQEVSKQLSNLSLVAALAVSAQKLLLTKKSFSVVQTAMGCMSPCVIVDIIHVSSSSAKSVSLFVVVVAEALAMQSCAHEKPLGCMFSC